MNRPAFTAGVGILAMAVLSALVAVVGPTGLLTGGDPGPTVRDIAASPETFRFCVAALVVVAVLDVVVAWGLYEVFARTNPGLARLAAWSRLAYAAIFAVAIAQLVGVPSPAELSDFHAVWQVALVLFGLHLVLVGQMAFTSGLVPKAIAVLVAVAGVGYLVDSFAFLLVPEDTVSIGAFTFIGELLLGLWLVAKGRHLAPSYDDARTGSSVIVRGPAPSPL